jgi:hypothetical protein
MHRVPITPGSKMPADAPTRASWGAEENGSRPARRTLSRLTTALAAFPGIHPRVPKGVPETPPGGWAVEVYVDRTATGVDSLERIAAACWEVTLGAAPGQRAASLSLWLVLRTTCPAIPGDEARPDSRVDRFVAVLAGIEPPGRLVTLLNALHGAVPEL